MDDTRSLRLQPPAYAPVILLLAVIIGGSFFVYGKKLETRPQELPPTLISVTGQGKGSVVPDVAELTFGFQAQHQATAKAAMDMLGKNMQKVLDAVKKAGVEDKDITTESLALNPAYDWTSGTQVMRGFDASESLRVKVRNLDSVSDVLAAATNAGANQAGNVNFTVDDPEKSRADARQKAIDQAQAKAQMLATQLHMHLGKLQSFSEDGGSTPPIMYARGGMAAEKSMDAVAPTPIPVGEQDVNVSVTLTYELR